MQETQFIIKEEEEEKEKEILNVHKYALGVSIISHNTQTLQVTQNIFKTLTKMIEL